jgi:hypothetical protein
VASDTSGVGAAGTRFVVSLEQPERNIKVPAEFAKNMGSLGFIDGGQLALFTLHVPADGVFDDLLHVLFWLI